MSRILVQLVNVQWPGQGIIYMREVNIVGDPPTVISFTEVDRIICRHVSARGIGAMPIPLLSTPLLQ